MQYIKKQTNKTESKYINIYKIITHKIMNLKNLRFKQKVTHSEIQKKNLHLEQFILIEGLVAKNL